MTSRLSHSRRRDHPGACLASPITCTSQLFSSQATTCHTRFHVHRLCGVVVTCSAASVASARTPRAPSYFKQLASSPPGQTASSTCSFKASSSPWWLYGARRRATTKTAAVQQRHETARRPVVPAPHPGLTTTAETPTSERGFCRLAVLLHLVPMATLIQTTRL